MSRRHRRCKALVRRGCVALVKAPRWRNLRRVPITRPDVGVPDVRIDLPDPAGYRCEPEESMADTMLEELIRAWEWEPPQEWEES